MTPELKAWLRHIETVFHETHIWQDGRWKRIVLKKPKADAPTNDG